MKTNRNIQLLLAVLLITALVITLPCALVVPTNATSLGFAGGNGTEADPYLIETKEHLNNVRNNLGAHYRLVADIEFAEVDFTANGSFYNNGSGFIPIGSKDEAFYGSFDGNGYSISNPLIYNSSTSGDAYAGLFAINNGVVKNLAIENGNISVYPDSNQYAYCGSIAGKNLGTISNCYSTGSVWSRRYAGGIAGYNSGTITDCYNSGAITASKDFDLSAGGIVGYNYDGTISNCYNNGQISSNANVVSTFRTTYYAFAGGIVGYGYDGTVEKCYNKGDVNATSNVTITENSDAYASANSGGIIGSNRSCSIVQCYNIGKISADTTADGYWYDTANSYAGGIVGSNASGIGSCYNVGSITTTSSTGHNYPGGIAGNNSGSISTSYNVANAIENIASSNSGTIKNCYFHSETLSAGCKLASLFSVLTYQGFNFESVWQMADGDYPLPVLRSVKNYASFEYSPEENTVDFASGKGTEADPFIIKTITHLDNIRKYPSSYFALANDITFEPENEAFVAGWKPFAFKGYLDGKGYKITGIRITVSNTLKYQWRDPGLFSSNDGTIKNLTVEKMRISVSNVGDKYGGFICAINNGTLINCHSRNCTISLQNIHHFFGGIVGDNAGSIQNCTSNNTINWGAIGGRVGGITANNTGSISGCVNNSTLTNLGSYTPISGGISAQNSGDIISSCNLVPIFTISTYSQRSGYSGGIVGKMTGGKISQCYNVGAITAEATEYKSHAYTGGIVAYISGGDIVDCYNTADVYGETNSSSASCYVGGIVGYNNSIGSIQNCYTIGGNSGRASATNLYVGYVCGYNSSNTIENCYYLGVVNNGSGSGDCATMYGKNIAALKSQDTYAGFDFATAWTTSGNADYPFPELITTPMVYEKEVKSIQIETLPTKLEYIENYESLDVTGGTIRVTYKYDEYAVIPLADASLSGFDNSIVGKQSVVVSYLGYTTEFEVEILEKSLSYIDLTTKPKKLIYTEGDLFDGAGMTITAFYNNDTSDVVTEYTVSGYSATPGTKTIIISFGNKTTSFTVVVYSFCEMNGHNYVDATCLLPKICSTCSVIHGEALGHSFTQYKSNNDATCTADGTETAKCDRCNVTDTRVEQNSAKGHDEVAHNAKIVTCVEIGWDAYVTCSRCNYTTYKEIAAIGHSYTITVVEPTFADQGYTLHTCHCGDSYRTDYTDALIMSALNVGIKADTAGKQTLSWNRIGDGVVYEVYRATKKTGTYTKEDTVTETTWTDTTSAGGATYYYKVKAVYEPKPTIISEFSNIVSLAGKCTAPAVAVENDSKGKPMLTWEKISGAKKYTIYRATSETGKYTKLGTATKTTYTDSKAKAGTTYFYKIVANASKSTYNSGYSNIVSCGVICGTPSVTVKIDTNTGKPSLSWGKVDGAAKYAIYRDGELLTTVTGTTYADTSAAIDTKYAYTVQALGKTEALNGNPSKEVSATAGIAKPAVKGSVDAVSGKPVLTWNTVEGAVKYEIYRSTKSNKSYKLLDTVETLNYEDTSVSAGKTYYYQVKAVGEVSKSADSSYVKLTGKCGTPIITVSASESSGKPVLSWEKISGAKKYTVYRATSETGKYTKLGTTTKLTYTDTKASAGTVYFYKIIANASSSKYNSSYSNIVSCGVNCAAPAVKVSLNASGKPVLSWSKVSGAVKYEIYLLGGEDYVVLGAITGTTWTDDSCAPGEGRYYGVRAIASKEAYNSEVSEPVSGRGTCATPKITGKVGANKKPVITWGEVESATKYIIYRSTSKSKGYKVIDETETLGFEDLTAKKGKTYYYKVVAVGNGFESAQSSYAKVKSK